MTKNSQLTLISQCVLAISLACHVLPVLGAQAKCIQIFYDHPKLANGTTYLEGRLYVIGLQNLLGHFPQVQQYIYPIEQYQKGQIEQCDAAIYIGSYFDNKLPMAFTTDFINSKKNVAWVGYNIWQLSADNLQKTWGVQFDTLARITWNKIDKLGRPGIYNDYLYKGESFERCKFPHAASTPEFKDHYNYDYDISILKLVNKDAKNNVLSWGQYSLDNKQLTPYILRNANHWYVADNPFKFICDGDRYFIFADILFDILNEPPQNGGKKFAFVRYEDVSPRQAPTNITTLTNIFHKLQVPFAISLVSIYADPLHVYSFGTYIEITQKPVFIKALQYAASNGGSFIMHGVSHQHGNKPNPFSGVTTEDYEFWDKSKDAPIAEDSVSYILNRLNKGALLLAKAGIKINSWMTAHYSASALDNVILGQVFTWNVGRGNYVISKVTGLTPIPENMTFDQGGVSQAAIDYRKKALSQLKVEALYAETQLNQIFPYEIYGDYYGRRMIPEDLGNLQPFINRQVIATRSVDNILRDAKRYRVLRDVWASYFIHDLLLNTTNHHGLAETEGDTAALERLISEIKKDGYEYIDLPTWEKTHTLPKRLEPIEPYPPY